MAKLVYLYYGLELSILEMLCAGHLLRWYSHPEYVCYLVWILVHARMGCPGLLKCEYDRLGAYVVGMTIASRWVTWADGFRTGYCFVQHHIIFILISVLHRHLQNGIYRVDDRCVVTGPGAVLVSVWTSTRCYRTRCCSRAAYEPRPVVTGPGAVLGQRMNLDPLLQDPVLLSGSVWTSTRCYRTRCCSRAAYEPRPVVTGPGAVIRQRMNLDPLLQDPVLFSDSVWTSTRCYRTRCCSPAVCVWTSTRSSDTVTARCGRRWSRRTWRPTSSRWPPACSTSVRRAARTSGEQHPRPPGARARFFISG